MSKKIVLLIMAVLCLLFSWSLVMAQEQKTKEQKPGTILMIPLIEEKGGKAVAVGGKPVAMGIGITSVMRKAVELEKILEYFKKFDVETIEVWVEGVTEANILVVSLGGNAGIKVILKPKR